MRPTLQQWSRRLHGALASADTQPPLSSAVALKFSLGCKGRTLFTKEIAAPYNRFRLYTRRGRSRLNLGVVHELTEDALTSVQLRRCQIREPLRCRSLLCLHR